METLIGYIQEANPVTFPARKTERASTLLNEQGWNRDAIERQLAHTARNSVRASYNFAEFLPERRKMMQAWSDYLDSLRTGPHCRSDHIA